MRKVHPRIYQGDSGDLNVLGKQRPDIPITLFVNVGALNYVPPNRFAVHMPMLDMAGMNDWEHVVSVALLAAEEVARGGLLFVNCDVGVSRSVVFCGMVLAVLEGADMDNDMLARVEHGFMPPLFGLWQEARLALNSQLRARPK